MREHLLDRLKHYTVTLSVHNYLPTKIILQKILSTSYLLHRFVLSHLLIVFILFTNISFGPQLYACMRLYMYMQCV